MLDELGREKGSGWAGEIVYVLVNAHYEGHLPTVLTTNLSILELDAAGYAPIVSRLCEGGRIVAMDSEIDYRTRIG